MKNKTISLIFLVCALVPALTPSARTIETTQYEPILKVHTDKGFYAPGEQVNISGSFEDSNGIPIAGASVGLEVRDPGNGTMFLDIIFSLTDGSYQDSFRLHPTSPSGDYHLFVTAAATGYPIAKNQTVFAVGIHDIASTNVTPSKNIVGQGYKVNITATIENCGSYTESFNLTIYANSTPIETQQSSLSKGNSTALTFTWNTSNFAKGSYTITAFAQPVQNETDISNNNFTYYSIFIGTPGDVNADGKVDVRDVYAVALAYGTSLEGPDPPGFTYNANCDINLDNKVDVKDYYIVCKHYGEVNP